jgi:acyl carrier protein
MTIDQKIHEVVLQLARHRTPALAEVAPDQALVAYLGLESRDIAQLVAMHEDDLGVDPFATTSIANIRTVADLCAAYRRALS